MARIEWDKDWQLHLDEALKDFMQDLADDVLHDMQETVPVKTGHLLEDLDNELDGSTARIGAKTVDYAIYVEDGTPRHIITPNTKQALWWEGAHHPVKRVNHPGAPATHFMRNALYRERRP